ncbi:MAG: PCP reductase family protein [Nitrospinota bacterium]
MEDFSNDEGITWSEEAKKRVMNAPDFVRPGIKKLMVIRAKERGMKEITSEFLSEIRDESMKFAARRMKNMGFEELRMKAFEKAKEKMKNFRKKEVIENIQSFLEKRTGKNQSILNKFEKYFNEIKSKESELAWTQEAKDRLEKAPSFVRGMAQKAIEDHAKKKGCKEVTGELISEVMDNLIPASVKQMMKKGKKTGE